MPDSVTADEYPARPIRIISAMAAGGLSDTAARFIVEPLGRQLGQKVIVENRSGAGGIVGTEAAARSPADGYTLIVSSPSAFNIIPAVTKTSFDPKKDFVPLGQIWSAPQVLIARSQSNLKTVADVVAFAKANPGRLAFGHAGNGTTTHLSIELFLREAQIKVVQVPYRSGAQTVVDLLGGQLDAVFVTPQTLAPYLQSGKVLPLAITDVRRSP
ncbi:MAG: tripartite tricarboxylate transporter substrate binding protein, partial [Betaproteobacteria bacterium]|nr:tripartite tricarboxylate transporter substrate binding protein [Betaproteobacteria bacterium]